MNHDVIVIGGSAGAVDVLLDLAGELRADLPAAIFIVLHVAAGYDSPLPELLARRGRLPARHPLHGEKIERGRIYVAAADTHMMLRAGSIEVVRGPKENGHRPAVDALFRTAAAAYGPRVIGVVLSGYQDCGTAGMMSIKARGGITVVQAPDSAAVGEMPRAVLSRIEVDHVVDPSELPSLLGRLTATTAGPAIQPDRFVAQLEGEQRGSPAELVCPTCQGVLTEARPGAFQHFRCHVGHAFSLSALVAEQSEEVERALWAAVRALEESAALSRRLAASERAPELVDRFAERAHTQMDQADLIRQILLHGDALTPRDAAVVSAAEPSR